MPEGVERLRAWTLVDELVLDVFVLTRKIAVQGYEDLPVALRGAALQAALKVVQGVHGGPAQLAPCARSALGALAEFRYYLYLCRRLGLIDVRRYRAVALRLEKIQRCLQELLVSLDGSVAPGGSLDRRPAGEEAAPAGASARAPRGDLAFPREEDLLVPGNGGP